MSKDSTNIENLGAPFIEIFIASWVKEQFDQEVDSDSNFATLGMDSLDAVRFTDDLAAFLGVEEVPVSLILDHPTAGELARHLAMVVAGKSDRVADVVSA